MKRSMAALLMAAMLAGVASAQQQDRGRDGGGMRGGGQGGGMRGGMTGGMTGGMRGGNIIGQFRELDTDESLLVDEQEIADGLAKIKAEAEIAYDLLGTGLDIDGDGVIKGDELEGAMEVIRVLQSIGSYDENKNLKLENSEITAATERMKSLAERYNSFMLRRYDADNNGKLSEKEVTEAKAQMENMRTQRQQRMQGGGRQDGGGNQR